MYRSIRIPDSKADQCVSNLQNSNKDTSSISAGGIRCQLYSVAEHCMSQLEMSMSRLDFRNALLDAESPF